MARIIKCFSIVKSNLKLLAAHVAAKFRDDLLIGTEHSYKVTPQCDTPQKVFLEQILINIFVK